jgi:hypothetical protein
MQPGLFRFLPFPSHSQRRDAGGLPSRRALTREQRARLLELWQRAARVFDYARRHVEPGEGRALEVNWLAELLAEIGAGFADRMHPQILRCEESILRMLRTLETENRAVAEGGRGAVRRSGG